MGRPKKQIDAAIVEKLAARFYSVRAIAFIVGVSDKTIADRFPEVIAKGREHGKCKLRDLQWKAAEAGNVAMLIWLGKQYLGQTEKIDVDVEAQQAAYFRGIGRVRAELQQDPDYVNYLREKAAKAAGGNGKTSSS